MNQTSLDLQSDFNEVRELASTAIALLKRHIDDLAQHKDAYLPIVYEQLLAETTNLLDKYVDFQTTAKHMHQISNSSEADIDTLISCKHEQYDMLRLLQGLLGSVLSASSRQSPSISHALYSQAGNETGNIHAFENDYKRDLHSDEKKFTKQFISEYVEHSWRFAPVAFATSSGMSAMTTALTHLAPGVKSDSVVLVGRSTYFQTKWILERLFSKQIVYVDEQNTQEVIRLAKQLQPTIVVFDSLSNNAVSMLDIATIIPALSKILSNRSTLVLDNTGLGVMCQPLEHLPFTAMGMRLIVVESLSKYHQFGLDRANGGVLWSPLGLSVQELHKTVKNVGTILSDTLILTHIQPNRSLFEARLARIGRNTLTLAQRIEELSKAKRTSIGRVIYPGLPSHDAYRWAHSKAFCGGFFVCEFKPYSDFFIQHQKFVANFITEAKKRNVELVFGSGFGFNSTRIYVLPEIKGIQKVLLRISVGIETQKEIELLGDAFVAALT